MQLLNFCNEILLTIINILPDESLINFSCTRRELCELAESQRKDRRYTALYGKIDLDAGQTRDCRWEHPMQVVRAVNQDPIIAQYIRSIHYSPPRYHPVPLPPTDDVNGIPGIENAIEKLPFLGDLKKRQWKEAVREHSDCCFNISFIILLSLCAKVTTLLFEGVHKFDGLNDIGCLHDLPNYLNPLIHYLCDNHYNSVQEVDATDNSPVPSNHLLPALTTLGLCCPISHNELRLRHDFTLLAIPTLRTLYLNKPAEGSYEDWSQWAWTSKYNRLCSVEAVEMFLGILDPHNLISLIENLPQLKTLQYSHFFGFRGHPYAESQDEFVDSCWRIGEGLLRERSLQMTFGSDRKGQLIIKFEKLKEVEEVTKPFKKAMEETDRRFTNDGFITDDYREA